MTSLNGKLIWITGASSGIGKAIAIESSRRGAKIILSARREEELNQLSHTINKDAISSYVYPVDVTKPTELKELVHSVEDVHGPIDILVANAGNHIFSVPEEFNSKEYLNLMDLNFGGILRSIEEVLPSMLKRNEGHIVGMASLAGIRGLPRAAAYGASKAAIAHFLESIRFHLIKNNIKVSVINPGFVKTPLTDKNDFYMPFLISTEKAASIICDGIEFNKRDISFPIPFNWIVKFGRFLPAPLYEAIINRLW